MSYDTIRDRINQGEFKNKLPYPVKEVLSAHREYRELGERILVLANEIERLKSRKCVLESDMKKAYRVKESKIVIAFRAALEEAYRLQDHPKRDKLWLRAWDGGHSGGYHEVLIVYDELAELVK